jgi:hypothetical protein
MNPATNTKVVSINAAGRERGPGLRVVNDCRERLGETLCRWLGGIRAPISEELFLLADGTRERLLQTRYLDLRQDIEKDWTQFVEAFRHSLADADIPQPTGGTLDVPDFEGLQLVEDEELSERIVVREFAAQLAESCDEELYSLDRRIAALLGHDEPQDGANLLAPIYICQALADAAAALGLDAESRLLLMRRIERHLHLALPSIYHDINAELIERNILPDLKRSYKRGGTTAATATGVGANAIDAALQAAAGNLTAPAGDILGAMERLVAARTQSLGANAGTQQASAASPATSNAAAISHAFLTSLNEAQHTEWVPTAGVLQNQVRAVRESDVAQQVSPVEAVTIDIVAMLFDFIFNDEELPATVKSLVGQLQIPVLKVAMLDHSFFANRQHPARRFLDGITGVALHWGAGAREGDPFLNRLELLVTRIQQEFETNIEIFGEAIADLENFVTAHEAEEAATVEIAADAVIRREAEEAAAERTQAALAPILARPQPEVVRNFLAEHWAAVLRQKALQTEADSAGWQDTVEVAEQLVWSVEPKSEADERLRLISSLPMLLARINAGLAMIAIDGSARGNFFDALVGLHAGALKGHVLETPPQEVAAPKDETPVLSEGDLLVTRRIEEGVVIEDVMLVGAPPMRRARDREALDQVRNLKRGDWVDFIDEEGNAARERLNWVSPQKGILVFSNHRAARAISISPDALARQIRDGAARVVADSSVFDKAIDGVMRSLNAA